MIRLAYRFFLGVILGPLQAGSVDPANVHGNSLCCVHRFHDEIVSGDKEAVERALNRRPSMIHERDDVGFSALHAVAGEPHYEIAKLLLSLGADPNSQSDDGSTPLHLVAYPYMAEILLRAGAAVNCIDGRGDTPLHIHASVNGSLSVMQMLLKNGAESSNANRLGRTALDVAVESADPEKIDLLSRGAANARIASSLFVERFSGHTSVLPSATNSARVTRAGLDSPVRRPKPLLFESCPSGFASSDAYLVSRSAGFDV